MPEWISFLLRIALETFTLFVLLVGLVGLVMPVFPGLVIMWLATLFYAIIQGTAGNMTNWDWVAFVIITLLMIGGSIIDNIIIAKKMRDHYIPWGSILLAFAGGIVVSLFFTPLVGLIAAPTVLFLAEQRRLQNRDEAWASTKAYLTGWGWAFGVRFVIGLAITSLWMLWAWI